MMNPTNGTRPMRYHQPERPVSCSRRTAAAIDGTRYTRSGIHTSQLAFSAPPMIAATMYTITYERKNHQYSGRPARPVNSAYLLKHVLTASPNDIGTSFAAATVGHGQGGRNDLRPSHTRA
jgi:hypothetical protein